MIHQITNVSNTRAGYETIASLMKAAKDLEFLDTLTVDFSNCGFFAANMAAPLGVALDVIESRGVSVKLDKPQADVQKILCKNSFFGFYGFPLIPDSNATTIPYSKFELTDDQGFDEFLSMHVEGHGMPTMSKGFEQAFKKKIYEVFGNASIHSSSGIGVRVCGQYFPHKDRLYITIADGGIGIRQNVRRYLRNPKVTSIEAIDWALKEGHSTKTGQQPGGLGLKFLQDFIKKNGGVINIISRMGFCKIDKSGVQLYQMKGDYIGTVVTLEINTGDLVSYRLDDEIALGDIF